MSDEQQVTILDEPGTNMKPLLGMAVKEAVKLALIDSVPIPDDPNLGAIEDLNRKTELRRLWAWDIRQMPAELLSEIDPDALGQNVGCRLLGTGGWFSNGVYAGNATPTEVLHSCVERPDQDHISEIAFDLGLGPIEEDDDA